MGGLEPSPLALARGNVSGALLLRASSARSGESHLIRDRFQAFPAIGRKAAGKPLPDTMSRSLKTLPLWRGGAQPAHAFLLRKSAISTAARAMLGALRPPDRRGLVNESD